MPVSTALRSARVDVYKRQHLLSCAVFVSVLLADVARSATGSETASFAVFAGLGGLSIAAGLYSLTCLMSQRLHDAGMPGPWALGFYALLALGIAGIRFGGIAGALMILPFAGLVFFGTRPSDPAHNIYCLLYTSRSRPATPGAPCFHPSSRVQRIQG